MIEALEKEKQYYIKHISEWIGTNQFKFVLIKDDNLIGFYNSIQEAFENGLSKFGLEDFFIKQILPKNTTNISFLGKFFLVKK